MISPAGHAALTLRSRLRCIIMRKNDELSKSSKPPTNLLVLNEVVIDRGPSPYLSNIDLFLDGKHITSVQGDGESECWCGSTQEICSFAYMKFPYVKYINVNITYNFFLKSLFVFLNMVYL